MVAITDAATRLTRRNWLNASVEKTVPCRNKGHGCDKLFGTKSGAAPSASSECELSVNLSVN